jgi:hypothetical protein
MLLNLTLHCIAIETHLHINQMHRHDQVLKLIGSLYYKSLILTGEDFFLFRDPPATPVLTFLFPDAAAAGNAGLGVTAMGEVLVSAAARPAAGIGPSSGKGSPACISHNVAASAAAADPLGILLTITLGEIPGFITQHSFQGEESPPLLDSGAKSAAQQASYLQLFKDSHLHAVYWLQDTEVGVEPVALL